MNNRRAMLRHFRGRMIKHLAAEARGGLARPLWMIAREYIYASSTFGRFGRTETMDVAASARIMRALGMSKKTIRAAIDI